jgi:hypothetical protein
MRCFSWLRWWLDWASETSFFFPTSWNSTRLFASHCGLPLSIPFARPCPPWKGRRKGLSRAGIEDCAQGIAQMSQLSQSGLNPYTGPHLYNNVKPRPCVSSELRMELMRLLSRAEHRIASHRIASHNNANANANASAPARSWPDMSCMAQTVKSPGSHRCVVVACS